MKDRQPTQVLANGAIRYGIYSADGTLVRYEYMKREDAPTVEGTPLNKANLLSDATEAKIWRGDDKPEEPTVNDALNKLADGTAKIGDIEITARTDLSASWLPCDGRTVSQEQYPELCSVLRTPDSPALWTQKAVSSAIGLGGDAISHMNGRWFRSYSDATSAHILVSEDGETWTEWAMPQNFWVGGTILSSVVEAVHAVKYLGGYYVCSAMISCAESSGASHKWGILFSDTLFGTFRVDAPDIKTWSESSASKRIEEFSKSCNDIFFDGTRFFVIGSLNYSFPTLRYTTQLSGKSASISADSQAWTASKRFSSDTSLLNVYTRQSDNATVILAYSQELNSSGNYVYYIYLYLVKTATNYAGGNQYISSEEPFSISSFFETNNDVYFFLIGETDTSGMSLYKCTIGDNVSCSRVSTYTGEEVTYTTDCNGQIVGTRNTTVKITENIEQGWDYTTTLPDDAGGQPAVSGTVIRIPCSSLNGAVKDILHDFGYDNKKIPNITTDTRSKAYIKALEE